MKRLVIILVTLLPLLVMAQPDSYEPVFQITGENPDSYLGSIIANCGDQNGDGCDELLLSNDNPSVVYMFNGGEPMDTIPDLTFYEEGGTPADICYGENLFSDEYGSLLISYIKSGLEIISLYNCDSELDTIPDIVFEAEEDNSCFGFNLGIGDFNGDGWNDIVTSASTYGSTSQGLGKIYVYFGGPDMDNIADFSFAEMFNNFGSCLGSNLACGDINGDGCDDILAMTSSPRKAWLFYGGAELDSIPDWSYQADSPVYLTTYCEIAPHLNGDQYSDMILLPSNAPESYIFYGGETISNSPDQEINPSVGYFVNVGDLNDDTLDDLVGRNEASSLLRPLYGNPNGPIIGDQIYLSNEPETVGFCGDVNGDGFDDIGVSTWEPFYYGQMALYADTSLTSISIHPSQMIPTFSLYQNYPNPFNSQTTIPFTLDRAGRVSLQVYDVLGREVQSLVTGHLSLGKHEAVWDGEGIASGVYFVQLLIDGRWPMKSGENQIRKVVLVK